jgi:hypothetical protein
MKQTKNNHGDDGTEGRKKLTNQRCEGAKHTDKSLEENASVSQENRAL